MPLTGMAPSLGVVDVAASVQFYVDRLGFTETGRWEHGGVVNWASAKRDGVVIMFGLAHDHDETGATIPPRREPGSHRDASLWLYVEDVAAVHRELVERGAAPTEPADQFYGLRECYVTDPDGYFLAFAQPID